MPWFNNLMMTEWGQWSSKTSKTVDSISSKRRWRHPDCTCGRKKIIVDEPGVPVS